MSFFLLGTLPTARTFPLMISAGLPRTPIMGDRLDIGDMLQIGGQV